MLHIYECLRGRKDCEAYGQIASTCGTSFFCCGEHDESDSVVPQDIYRVCFKGEFRDEMSNNDKRDLVHNMSVLAEALAVIEEKEPTNDQR